MEIDKEDLKNIIVKAIVKSFFIITLVQIIILLLIFSIPTILKSI